MLQGAPRATASSNKNCGTWVVLPQPVAPEMTTTPLGDEATAATTSSRIVNDGSFRLVGGGEG